MKGVDIISYHNKKSQCQPGGGGGGAFMLGLLTDVSVFKALFSATLKMLDLKLIRIHYRKTS